jgi:hypothetical protein
MRIAMAITAMRGTTIETARIVGFLCGLVVEGNEVGEDVMLLVGLEAIFGELFDVIDAGVVTCVDFSVAGREKVAELMSGDDVTETVIILVEVESMLNGKD